MLMWIHCYLIASVNNSQQQNKQNRDKLLGLITYRSWRRRAAAPPGWPPAAPAAAAPALAPPRALLPRPQRALRPRRPPRLARRARPAARLPRAASSPALIPRRVGASRLQILPQPMRPGRVSLAFWSLRKSSAAIIPPFWFADWFIRIGTSSLSFDIDVSNYCPSQQFSTLQNRKKMLSTLLGSRAAVAGRGALRVH